MHTADDHNHRTLRDFGVEQLLLLLGYVWGCIHLPPSMVGYLERTAHSSIARWKFATDAKFLALVIGYFPLAFLLNRSLGFPENYSLLAVQLIGVAVLFLLAFLAKVMISEGLAASLKFSVVAFATIALVAEKFTNFVPEVRTPPPNR